MIICTVTKKERIEKHLILDYPYPKWPIPKRTRIRIKWCERSIRSSQWSGQSGATIQQVRKLPLDIIYSPPTPAYQTILRKRAEVNQRWSINYYLSTSMYTKRCWLTHRVISPPLATTFAVLSVVEVAWMQFQESLKVTWAIRPSIHPDQNGQPRHNCKQLHSIHSTCCYT